MIQSLKALLVSLMFAVMGMGSAQGFQQAGDAQLDAASRVSRSRLSKTLQQALDRSRQYIGVPGAVAFVEQPDGTTWRGASGLSDLENMKGMTTDLKFRLASASKTFTATVTLQLIDEKKFSLDDSLESILPGVMPNAANVTVRQLLNMTSGYFDYIQAQTPVNFLAEVAKNPQKVWTHEELLDVAKANSPYFEPGEEGYHYSNTNYILLGMIIEKVTGKSFAENVKSRILTPLGLTNTSVPSDTEIGMPSGSTRTYFYYDSGKGSTWNDTTDISAAYMYSAGNLISTAGDLQKWLAALMSGRLISTQSRVAMFTYVNDSYGLGVEKIGSAEGHTGDSVYAGQSAAYQYKGWRFIILCNSAPKDSTVLDGTGVGFGTEYIMTQLIAALQTAGVLPPSQVAFTFPVPADYSGLSVADAFQAAHKKFSAEYALSTWKDKASLISPEGTGDNLRLGLFSRSGLTKEIEALGKKGEVELIDV